MFRKSVLPVVIFLAACTGEPRDEDVVAIINAHNTQIMESYAAGEIDELAEHFSEDAWQMPPNNPPLVGREAIRGFWKEATSWGQWRFELEAQQVDVSGPMAVERGKYVVGFEPGSNAPPGMTAFEDRGNYLVHWRREADGQWRIVADAPVSELPLPTLQEKTGPGKLLPNDQEKDQNQGED